MFYQSSYIVILTEFSNAIKMLHKISFHKHFMFQDESQDDANIMKSGLR